MNTNHDNEDTKFATDDEATKYATENKATKETKDDEATDLQTDEKETTEGNETEENAENYENTENAENAPEADGKSKWKKAAAGAGLGVALGSVAAFTMGMQSAENGAEPIGPDPDPSHPSWSDGNIPVATNVNDSMSQGEAFAAAREEVGPGGAFEWHGNVYSTYTAEEWADMSPAEQNAFNDHFPWNHGSGNTSSHSAAHQSHTAHHNEVPVDNTTPENQNGQESATASTESPTTGDDDINIISVDHPGDNNLTAETVTHDPQGDDLLVTPADPEIEILGVVHNADNGSNIGAMLVDGNEVVVVDVDGDMTFDVMAADINGNGDLDNNEIIDIHDQGLTVDHLGGFSNPTDDLMASNDMPDYSSDPIDPVYEG